jgi:hypothetical protein
MGGLVYSNGLGSNTDLNAYTQVIEWHKSVFPPIPSQS